MKLFKNLLGYKEEGITQVTIDNREYLTNTRFKPEYIIALAFGSSHDKDSYNRVLAQTVRDAAEYFQTNTPLIVQTEIGPHLRTLGMEPKTLGKVYAPGETSLIFSKENTRQILVKSKNLIDRLKLPHNKALLVAHPYHIQRVLTTASEEGIEGRPFIPKEIEWPKKDPQFWARGPVRFSLRELIARKIA